VPQSPLNTSSELPAVGSLGGALLVPASRCIHSPLDFGLGNKALPASLPWIVLERFLPTYTSMNTVQPFLLLERGRMRLVPSFRKKSTLLGDLKMGTAALYWLRAYDVYNPVLPVSSNTSPTTHRSTCIIITTSAIKTALQLTNTKKQG